MSIERRHGENHRHVHYTKHHPGFGYAWSLWLGVYSYLLAPLILIILLFSGLWFLGKLPYTSFANFVAFIPQTVSSAVLSTAIILTVVRLTVAYILALLVAVPLALLVTHNATMERLFLPFFDVLESVPALAFFPVLVVFFVNSNFLNGAAIFILFLGMVWNIVFSLIGGIKVIPNDIKSAAQVFGIRRFKYFRWVLLPAVTPYLVTGSILAWAQGWNILIVAEVLHTYIPGGTPAQDLLGLGTMLVQTSAAGQHAAFMYVLVVMTTIIALMNFFIWQKLLHYVEKFRFE